jgi:hypothetical protein
MQLNFSCKRQLQNPKILIVTLPLPRKLVELPIVIFSTQVEALEKPIIPKPIQLVLPKIREAHRLF